MEKVKVDSDRCIRCGACIFAAQENFDYGEDGESVVINDTVTEETREAAEMCPVSAIEIYEDDNDTENSSEETEEAA